MREKKRKTPLFVSEQKWIVCLDEICGFVGTFQHFGTTAEMLNVINAKVGDCYTFEQYFDPKRDKNILLEIDYYLFGMEYSDENTQYLQRKLKLAMKRYIHNLIQLEK